MSIYIFVTVALKCLDQIVPPQRPTKDDWPCVSRAQQQVPVHWSFAVRTFTVGTGAGRALRALTVLFSVIVRM